MLATHYKADGKGATKDTNKPNWEKPWWEISHDQEQTRARKESGTRLRTESSSLSSSTCKETLPPPLGSSETPPTVESTPAPIKVNYTGAAYIDLRCLGCF